MYKLIIDGKDFKEDGLVVRFLSEYAATCQFELLKKFHADEYEHVDFNDYRVEEI
jgi:hypothetical protein